MPEQHVARSPQDLVDIKTLTAMSGLEFITGMLNGELPGPPIAGVMNFHFYDVALGRVTFHGTPEFQHLNPMGGVHGGWYGAILDSAMGCAVHTTVAAGSLYTTLEYKVNIIRALKPGVLVACTGQVQHSGRSTAIADATLRGVEDGRLYATGTTTCIILQP